LDSILSVTTNQNEQTNEWNQHKQKNERERKYKFISTFHSNEQDIQLSINCSCSVQLQLEISISFQMFFHLFHFFVVYLSSSFTPLCHLENTQKKKNIYTKHEKLPKHTRTPNNVSLQMFCTMLANAARRGSARLD
jgi:hypothetical protein